MGPGNYSQSLIDEAEHFPFKSDPLLWIRYQTNDALGLMKWFLEILKLYLGITYVIDEAVHFSC